MSTFRELRELKSSSNRVPFKRDKGEVKMVGFEAIELQLQAQLARSSYLQSRLSSTMDTLDAARIRHRRELTLERETREMVKRKLDELIEYTAKVEEERDELRECVAALIDKVEVNNDFSTWPHRNISLLEPLEPIQDAHGNEVNQQKRATRQTGACQAFDNYPTIIALLRSELEKERASHARTHDTAELEILTLRAQLARREADLEAYIGRSNVAQLEFISKVEEAGAGPSHHGYKPSRLQPASKNRPQKIPASSFTPEEASKLLGLRSEKNRRLEAEIKEIAARLEQARAESTTPQASSTETVAEELSREAQAIAEDDNDTVVNALPSTFPEPKTPNSPDLHPIISLDMPSPFTMTPQRPASPVGLVQLAVRNSTIAPDAVQFQQSEPPVTESLAIQKLEEQVGRLIIEIDAFRVQRQDISEVIERERQARVIDTPPRELDRNLHCEENLSPPSDIENAPMVLELRSQIEQIKHDAAQREAELLAEIQTLRDAAEKKSIGHLTSEDLGMPFIPAEALAQSSAKRRGPLSEHDEEDDGGEKSMDLDTPSIALATFGHSPLQEDDVLPRSEEYDLDASLIPLPPSPIPDDETDILPPPSPLGLQDRPPTPFFIMPGSRAEEAPPEEVRVNDVKRMYPPEERLKALETELADAREQVADRDMVLVELQRMINDLRAQMRDAGMKVV
ncbi:hypothetical protein BDY19DRAFT_996513 [Irpex rosettiformis]|uniref:Uncharacterized protein n=1 Tax=Irpex rosettiformis TaxID=378272 RepID=A0ACB8TV33_9APHY|nr:hypothetical protein BDY19DRAFT_996513 [Irpex rosettiformis]